MLFADLALPPSKATLHFQIAFWGMLLPVTVHERVSDIWRSYFTQALLPSAGAVAAFGPAWVKQVREVVQGVLIFKGENGLEWHTYTRHSFQSA